MPEMPKGTTKKEKDLEQALPNKLRGIHPADIIALDLGPPKPGDGKIQFLVLC